MSNVAQASNSHFRLLINKDAQWARYYLCSVLVHHFPGIQIQEAGKISDHINGVVDAYNGPNQSHLDRYKNIPNLKIILITGEPQGTRAAFVHLIIDCKRDANLRPKGLASVYLPFYVMSFAERLHHPSDILLPQGFDARQFLQSKSKFCAFMYSAPCEFRERLFDTFCQRYKSPDALGVVRGNKSRGDTDRVLYDPLVKTYYESAVEKYKPYKFVIACENSRIDGYITEKLMNPTLARAVPIYLGAPDLWSDGVFNRKAIIHVGDFPSFEACVDHVAKVDQNDDLYLEYLREPLFIGNKLPDYFNSDYLLPHIERVFA